MGSYVISVSAGTGCYRHIQISKTATLHRLHKAIRLSMYLILATNGGSSARYCGSWKNRRTFPVSFVEWENPQSSIRSLMNPCQGLI